MAMTVARCLSEDEFLACFAEPMRDVTARADGPHPDFRFPGADRLGWVMGWTPPTASLCQNGCFNHSQEASVFEVTTIGLDIAKTVFHAYGAEHCEFRVMSPTIPE